MTNIKPLVLANPALNVLSDKHQLVSSEMVKDHTELLKGMSDSQRESVIKEQRETPQNTVIEHNGKIIGSFGDNGYKFFSSNGDAAIAMKFDPSDISRTLAALQNHYKGELKISSYAHGEGPTRADVYERIHGARPTKPVSTFV